MKNRKEQPVRPERSLTIDITPTRGLLALLALVLAAAAFLGTLAWNQTNAAASGPQTSPAALSGMREYYLTQSPVDGNEALTACTTGYHMASLWEILDPSNLEYNSDLGYDRDDSGGGPPAYLSGWVRTGWDSSTNSGVHGRDNCAAWASDSSGHYGTYVYLSRDWTAGLEDLHIWNVSHNTCNLTRHVWCVED